MDATIKEGNVGRSFSPVDKLKINLQNDGGESLWVPEDSVQLDELYTSTNGTYYAAPRDIYGWGVVTVDVDNSIDEPDDLYDDEDYPDEEPGGDDDWYFIDPDTGDRVDIEEDENGWYFIDPDTGDRVDIEEDDDGWYFIDPDTGERVDIEDDDSWDDWDDEPDEDWDEDGEDGDEEDDDDWDDDDWGDDDEDWDEEGDDEDDGITDGDDYDYIDDDGNLVEEECPASIKVMHVPNKTEYTDGWAIDYEGLIVQAFDGNGNPWSSPEYPDGYIPAHKLNPGQKYADYSSGHSDYVTPDYSDNVTEITSIGSIEQITKEKISEEAIEIADSSISDFLDNLGQYDGTNVCIAYNWIMPELNPSGYSEVTGVTPTYDVAFVFDQITNPVNPSQYYPGTLYRVWFNWLISESNPKHNYFKAHPSTRRESRRIFAGVDRNGNISSANMTSAGGRINSVEVSWDSPCLNTFTDSFDITVNEREDHGGSHHSGKF